MHLFISIILSLSLPLFVFLLEYVYMYLIIIYRTHSSIRRAVYNMYYSQKLESSRSTFVHRGLRLGTLYPYIHIQFTCCVSTQPGSFSRRRRRRTERNTQRLRLGYMRSRHCRSSRRRVVRRGLHTGLDLRKCR